MGARFERELDEELRDFLDALTAEYESRGLGPAEARRRALAEAGGAEPIKEAVRAARRGHVLSTAWRDARLGLRALRRTPLFAAVSILTLGLGIGGTTALFSVVRTVVAAPLAYPEGDRLVHIWAHWTGGFGNLSFPDFVAIGEQNWSFDGLAVYEPWGGVTLTGGERPERVEPNFVTHEYLPLLGARPARGRLFRAEEAAGVRFEPSVILSHAFWQRQFAGDEAVLGRALLLNGSPFTVIGVVEERFRDLGLAEDGDAPDVWLPAGAAPSLLQQAPLSDPYRIHWGLGRLRDGVSLAHAGENLNQVAERMARERPTTHSGYGLSVQPLRARINGPLGRPAALAFAGAGLLLLLGCTNLAASLMVRMERRRVEMAVRSALGASANRLLRQLVVEALALAALGGALGMALAVGITRLIANWIERHLTGLVAVELSAWALVCALALTTLTAFAFGLWPALEGRRVDLRGALATGRRTASAPRFRGRWLVVAQVAVAAVFLTGAVLMSRSLRNLVAGEVGYRPDALLTFRLDLASSAYAEPAARARFVDALSAELGSAPSVESVTVWGPSMLGNATWVVSVFPDDQVPQGPEDFVMLFRQSVNPGALENLGTPLLRGRDLAAADTAATPLVGVVSESVARQFWPGQEAVGKRLRRLDPSLPRITVVGVAADAVHRHRYSLDALAAGELPGGLGPQRDIYLPYAQRSNPVVTIVLRTAVPPAALAAARRAVGRLDPELAISDARMAADRLAEQSRAPAALATLFGGFALFALLLAVIGVHGVVAQVAAGRSKEFAIRLALGASAPRLVRGLLRGGGGLALAGVALGAAAAVVLTRFLSNLLYGVERGDPAVHLGVAATLVAAALVASYLPARAAVRGGVLRALREE